MPGWAGPWRAALRMARRDALRTKDARRRSLIVALMVGVPVLLAVFTSVTTTTNDVSTAESLPWRLGQAQALVATNGSCAVVQDTVAQNVWPADPDSCSAADPAAQPPSQQQLAAQTGGRLVPFRTGPADLVVGDHRRGPTVAEFDSTDPVTGGMATIQRGRRPTAAGEIAVSPELVSQGFTLGARPRLSGSHDTVTVVGILTPAPRGYDVVATPGTLLADVPASYLLDRATPLTWTQVLQLNRSGVSALSRQVVLDPPSRDRLAPQVADSLSSGSSDSAQVAVIAVTSIVIEVVLLAGPAFAVGVRRQRRQLALVAAGGGTRRQVARVILVQAVVLGGASAVLGAGLGLGVALGLYRWGTSTPLVVPGAPLDVRALHLLLAVALGACAAVIAAWVPARQVSREDIVLALTGRRGPSRFRRGWPVVGLVVAGLGAAITFTAVRGQGGEIRVAWGTIALVLGVLAIIPTLVGLVGRLGGRLPLPLRLATRDAARHRGRTAPAIAAIMATVAGLTALSIGGTSDDAQARHEYSPQLAAGQAQVVAYGALPTVWPAVVEAVRSVLPDRTAYLFGSPGYAESASDESVSVAVLPPGCTTTQPEGEVPAAQQDCWAWSSYPTAPQGGVTSNEAVVAEPAALTPLGYQVSASARSALEAGEVLVTNPRLLRPDGTVRLETISNRYRNGTSTTSRTLSDPVPAVAVDPSGPGSTGSVSALAMTPQTADRLGVRWGQQGVVLSQGPPVTAAQEAALNKATSPLLGDSGRVYVERGYRSSLSTILLVLAVVALIAVLIGTLTATGLALSDAEPDFATLAAVGASARMRRLVAGGQALVIAISGAVLGVIVGLVPGIAVTWPLTATSAHGPIIAIPWLTLAATVLVVPTVAAAASMLLTRSRVVMVRRLAQ